MIRPAILVLLAALSTCPPGLPAADEDAKKSTAVVPVFSLNRAYTEIPMGDDLLFGTSGGESFQQLLSRLRKARDDEDVKAIVVLGGTTQLGRGQIQEVRRVMDELRQADKPVYVHAESLSMRSYVLFSGAKRISVVPTGDLWLTGISASSLHVRGLLDKIGVVPDYMTCGAYKSAAEMFTRSEPSPEAAENLNWLLDGLFEEDVNSIASSRRVQPETVRSWIDQGLYSAEAAKQAGIIDAVEFRQDFVDRLKEKYGEDVKFNRKYAKKKRAEIDFSSPVGILKFYAELFAGPRRSVSGKDAVAIVYVEGPIVAGSSDPSMFPFGSQGIAYSTPIRRALDKAAADDSIKAVVLRVNSPGGSAVASEIILQATRRVRDKKPFVVSMGDVAGSGGYYVACAADTIFAEPSTITASIGVVGGKLVTRGMWDKVGVRFIPFHRGASAGILSSQARFTDQERDRLQAWMNEIYDVFKGHVRDARGDRLKEDLEELAGGRVFTGRQALERGLVDRMGGLYDAIAFAAEQAGLEDYEVRVVPRPKALADLLRESLMGESEDEEQLQLSLMGKDIASRTSLIEPWLPYLKHLNGDQIEALQVALRQLEILNNEQVALAMPVVVLSN